MHPSLRGAPLFAVLTLALTVASPREARADAVSPPPSDCPRGQIGVTSHDGAECVLAAPTDCAPGWRGVQRGGCDLALCDGTDKACDADERCAPADLCVVESIRNWSYGSVPALRGPELAAPPQFLSNPQHDFYAVDACGRGSTCTAGRCEALHVCLPRGKTRPASAARAGYPAGRTLARSVSEADLAKGEGHGAPPVGGSAGSPDGADEIPGSAPRGGGCAGCATARSKGSAMGLVMALVALAAAFVRATRP